jgi:uncharacterized protein with HEPN domain
MLPSDAELLQHIKEESIFILNNTANKQLQDVLQDGILNRAIIRSLEIIGEASKKLSIQFKLNHTKIEWKKMAATRDKLIHDYFGIDYEIVWDIIENKLPNLYKEVSVILDSNNFES